MNRITRVLTTRTLLCLMLLGGYLVWANIEQTRSAHAGWVADFHDPRQLVGAASAVFVGRVIEQTGTMSVGQFPQTQFEVEVLDQVKSVRKVNPRAWESLPAQPAPLPQRVIVDQYGGHIREITGKRTQLLMDDQHLLLPGQIYLLATAYDPDHNWYHVLPAGAVLLDSADKHKHTLEKFKKAKKEEIPLTRAGIGGGVDTPDPPLTTP